MTKAMRARTVGWMVHHGSWWGYKPEIIKVKVIRFTPHYYESPCRWSGSGYERKSRFTLQYSIYESLDDAVSKLESLIQRRIDEKLVRLKKLPQEKKELEKSVRELKAELAKARAEIAA